MTTNRIPRPSLGQVVSESLSAGQLRKQSIDPVGAFRQGILGFEDALTEILGYGVDHDWLAGVLEDFADLIRDPTSPLSEHDRAILAQSGLTTDRGKAGAAIVSSSRDARLVAESALTVADAATRLGVTPAHIRQRIAEGTLWSYTDRQGGGRRLPACQFIAQGAVPLLESVIGVISAGIAPLAFHRLLTLPQPGLVLGGELVSVAHWLAASGGRADRLTVARDLVRSAVWEDA